MNTLPIASTFLKDAMDRTARSALPDAPVLPFVEPPVRPTRRARLSLVSALRRTAAALEPAECRPAT